MGRRVVTGRSGGGPGGTGQRPRATANLEDWWAQKVCLTRAQ